MAKKLGLVLAGGGGRGAYQIGVWKYLQEIGLDQKISVISGVSVGALNGTLFACSNLEQAEHIWTHGLKDKLVPATPDEPSDSASKFFPQKLRGKVSRFWQVAQNGLCSKEGLCQLIEENIDWEKLRKTSVRLYATCCKLPFLAAEHFLVNDKSLADLPSHVKKILCATSALPGMFPAQSISSQKYIDGGFMYIDNVPHRPLETTDICSDVIVVRLDKVKLKHQLKSTSRQINYVTLLPTKDLGKIMDFSAEGIKWRIAQGYDDCKKIYSKELEVLAQQLKCTSPNCTL